MSGEEAWRGDRNIPFPFPYLFFLKENGMLRIALLSIFLIGCSTSGNWVNYRVGIDYPTCGIEKPEGYNGNFTVFYEGDPRINCELYKRNQGNPENFGYSEAIVTEDDVIIVSGGYWPSSGVSVQQDEVQRTYFDDQYGNRRYSKGSFITITPETDGR